METISSLEYVYRIPSCSVDYDRNVTQTNLQCNGVSVLFAISIFQLSCLTYTIIAVISIVHLYKSTKKQLEGIAAGRAPHITRLLIRDIGFDSSPILGTVQLAGYDSSP